MNKHLIDKELLAYCEQHTSAESNYLYALNRETYITQMQPHMLSGHLQGRFLAMISKLVTPTNILEIGTYTGYAALCLAEGLSANGKLVTIDIDAEKLSLCKKYFQASPYNNKIEMIIGNALEIIPSLPQQWDLVFIDADKVNYTAYYNLVIDKLSTNGILLLDNMLFNAEVLNETKSKNAQAVHELNKIIANDARVEQVLLPLRDGISMVRKVSS
jgi:caffeoyl-CoA O-methyltransferase